MVPDFDVWDVSCWESAGAEPAGLDEKLWLRDPETDERWLFKPVTVRGTFAQGEDWSEKLASEIARLLGVPCARVELATRDGRTGSISLNLRPSGWAMHAGSDVLAGIVPGYRTQLPGREGHSLDNVAAVLRDSVPPPDTRFPESFMAFDVFAGYLVLDAVIANQDRHDQNWSILQPPSGPDALAGSYDHASSLSFNLRESERERRLRDDTVGNWAARGRATRFEHPPGEPAALLTAHAGAALRQAGAQTRNFWLARVASLRTDDIDELVNRVPDLSHPARRFVSQLVMINRRRVLDDC